MAYDKHTKAAFLV